MLYELIVCAGITGWGCGHQLWSEFPNEAACHVALKTMVVAHNGEQKTGESGRQVIAYCRPKPPEKPEKRVK